MEMTMGKVLVTAKIENLGMVQNPPFSGSTRGR